MAHGPEVVTRQDIAFLKWNAVLHHNEIHNAVVKNAGVHTETYNAGVQETMNAPQNCHNDPQ